MEERQRQTAPTSTMDERIRLETSAMELEEHGEAFITVGKALIGMDMILVCFVEISVRTGSRLFIWWVILEGLLGLICVIIGVTHKSKAHEQLSSVEPE